MNLPGDVMRILRAGFGLLLMLYATNACGGSEPGRDTPPDSVRASVPDPIAAPPPPAADVLDSIPDGPSASEADGRGAAARPAAPAAPSAGGATTASPAARDSAAQILARAAERYRAIRSLQADFTMRVENPLLRSTIASAGVLYQKRPDRLLLRFTEPAGDVIVSDGEYFWVYYPSVNAEQVMRSPAAASGSTGVDLQAQFLGDPTERFRYTLEGTDAVGGRPAWRMLLVPRERVGYRSLRVWLDQADHLARRFEITEDNGSVRHFELRNLRLDPAIADRLFQFQVPSGARVISP
jgi:outer membrane lipoprotein-sorting protein